MNNIAATYTKTSFDARNLLLLLYGEEYAIQLPLLPEEAAMEENLPNIAIQFKGQEEGNAQLNVAVFPNPAANEVNFVLPATTQGNLTIQLFNYAGQLAGAFNFSTGQPAIVHTSEIPQGIYCYRILQNNAFIAQGKLALIR